MLNKIYKNDKRVGKTATKQERRKKIGTQAKWIGIGVAICIVASACLIKPVANVGTKAAADTIGTVAPFLFHTRDPNEIITNEEKTTDVTDKTSDSNGASAEICDELGPNV